ncbi:DUF6402 family protein [Silvimonas amylolytica]|uniref:Uncharacterized protein n=1 Tax=Silvimonas amylolytica TaxID=449663 RepID=A0ABQ2PMW1_9NEIS|nr:DUF6402 family protein [Silvimonas amylolytica]GGP26710.1 hypothetical protein GCM10010971_25290 [Silvimonas amylolytica]
MSIATSTLTLISNPQGTVVSFKPLELDEIPGAMDKMDWPISARMMRRWFANPQYVMSEAEKARLSHLDARKLDTALYDDQTVKMDWALAYPRVQAALTRLIEQAITSNSVNILRRHLQVMGWKPGADCRLGRIGGSARELDATCQIQYCGFGARMDTIDDLYGAIGTAILKLAVVGQSKGAFFYVEKLGVYIRDTYDFTDAKLVLGKIATPFHKPEPLGIWSRDRCLSKYEMVSYMAAMNESWSVVGDAFPGFVPVFNIDFRRWQDKHHSGGDFLVYSDVKWFAPPPHMAILTL